MATSSMPAPLYRLLRGTRNRPLLPHRICAPMRDEMLCKAEIFDAFATTSDDDRWARAADALRSAAECLRDVSR